MGRLPLSLALLYEAAPETVDAVRDAYPDAMRNEEIVADYRNHGKLADYAHCAKCEPEPPRASGWERGHQGGGPLPRRGHRAAAGRRAPRAASRSATRGAPPRAGSLAHTRDSS
ncbi:hypothetical protein JL720_6341 [Aureococcus anophagefferens]|nr:hypothetical protein JL720_6341 [Aureococcus anophagefferens]